MSPTVILGILLLCVSLPGLFWLVVAGPGASQRAIRSNLSRGFDLRTQARTAARVRSVAWGRRLTTPAQVSYLERLVLRAGRPDAWPIDRVLNAKLLVALTGLAVGGLVFAANPSGRALVLWGSLATVGYFLPDLLLYNQGIKRRQAIALELPDTLDQMSIAVEAGLGFDAAMVRVARNGKGVLAGEMIRALQDIQIGQPRRDAFEALAFRAHVPELRRFMRAVVQAEEYGIALADVLHTQAREMRITRRQRAEAKAMEIPVKVTFPLILLILPVLLIVIMGPAVINIMEAFGGR